MKYKLPLKSKQKILAMGAEFDSTLAFYNSGEIILSENTQNLAQNPNEFLKFSKKFIHNLKPDIIAADLHPNYTSLKIGNILAEKYKAKLIKIQHHSAHACSSLADYWLNTKNCPQNFMVIACDGTGYGADENIWGGEILKLKIVNCKLQIERIGHLENQTMIGGNLAIQEPARMLIAILAKFLSKKEVFKFVQKYYSQNKFELIWNQMRAGFNCQQTSSAGRVLDAVSLLLEFSENKRNYKHQAIKILEKRSEKQGSKEHHCITEQKNIAKKICKTKNLTILSTTNLFKYLIKNLKQNKPNLAFQAQIYLTKGLWQIANKASLKNDHPIFFSGGVANNKLMANYLRGKGVYLNKKISPGDPEISVGQIIYCLFNSSQP